MANSERLDGRQDGSAFAELDRYRDKWREAPLGSDTDGRMFSSDLLAMSDEKLLAAWDAMAGRRYGGEIGWLGPLYFDTFRASHVLELGSGLGFDGIRFAEAGALWTFADIVPDNLDVIRRIACLKGLSDRVRFHLIDDDLSFSALPADYDVIWVFGSIHHVPFEIARKEALEALSHLKPAGRWMELVYPRERWLREGAPAFEEWGKLTDGERTPWAEWHDIEKVRRRLFPAAFRTVLDFEFCSHNYRWFDLQYASDRAFRLDDFDVDLLSRETVLSNASISLKAGARRTLKAQSFRCPAGLFAPAAELDLAGAIRGLQGDRAFLPGIAVDIDCTVDRGSVGFGLVDVAGAYLPGAETVVESGPDSRRVTLRATAGDLPSKLIIRNLRSGCRSAFTMRSAAVRIAG